MLSNRRPDSERKAGAVDASSLCKDAIGGYFQMKDLQELLICAQLLGTS